MRLNLMMGVFWLCAAVTLLVFALQGKKVAGLDPDRVYIVIGLTFVLTLYNLARHWAARNRRQPPATPKKRILYGEQQEYLPEFDFDRQPDPSKLKEKSDENRSNSAG